MEKKKIYLFCSAGMSTTLLVQKMEKASKDSDELVEIHAFPVSDITNKGAQADVILLGPQVKYMEHKVQEQFPNINVNVISLRDYGMMDGQKVFEDAVNLIK